VNKKYGSRKLIVAVLLMAIVLLIFQMVLSAVPAAGLAIVVPSLVGMATAVLTAVAIMYPAFNAITNIKGKADE